MQRRHDKAAGDEGRGKPHCQRTEDPWLVEALPVGLSCESARAEERDQHEQAPEASRMGEVTAQFFGLAVPLYLRCSWLVRLGQ